MQTDLSTFSFKIFYKGSNPSKIVDWDFVKVDKEDITPQIIKFEFEIVKTGDTFEVSVLTNIFLSCYELHKIEVSKGTFYHYDNISKFKVDTKSINSIVVSELVQAHYITCIENIALDTKEKTNGQNIHLLQVPSLATTILTVESVHYNYNL
jgi:hypothetical protein